MRRIIRAPKIDVEIDEENIHKPMFKMVGYQDFYNGIPIKHGPSSCIACS